MTRPASERWPGARASRSAGAGAGRAAHAPRRCRPGGGTSCAASTGSRPPRAAWRGPAPAVRLRSAWSAGPAGPLVVPTRSKPGQAWSAGAPCVDVGAGRGWPAVSRAPRTRGRSLLAGPAPRWPASVVLVAVEVLQGDPQELGSFFLDLEQSLHALEAPMQPGVLPLQILYPRIQRLRLRTPLPRLQLSLRRLLALAAPEDQVGRIEALAPQQGPDFTRPLAGIGFPHDPQLVLRRESPPLRPRYHLGIGHILPRARRPALDHGGPSAPRRLASLAAAPLRVPHGRLLNAQRQVLDQAPFASPPCTLNSRGSAVSRMLARRVVHGVHTLTLSGFCAFNTHEGRSAAGSKSQGRRLIGSVRACPAGVDGASVRVLSVKIRQNRTNPANDGAAKSVTS